MAKCTLAGCVFAAGPLAGILLYRLGYWIENYPESFKGSPANGNPSSWWSEQTGLSVHQVTRAIRRLVAENLVLVVTAPQPKRHLLRVRWLILTDQGRSIVFAKSQVGKSSSTNGGLKSASIDLANSPGQLSKGSSKDSATDVSTTAVGGKETLTTIDEVEDQVKMKAEILALETEWRAGTHIFTKEWVAKFSGTETKWAADLLEKVEGQDVLLAAKLVTTHWLDFRDYLADAKGLDLKKLPEQPNFLTVLQYPTQFIGFAAFKKQADEEKAIFKKKPLSEWK